MTTTTTPPGAATAGLEAEALLALAAEARGQRPERLEPARRARLGQLQARFTAANALAGAANQAEAIRLRERCQDLEHARPARRRCVGLARAAETAFDRAKLEVHLRKRAPDAGALAGAERNLGWPPEVSATIPDLFQRAQAERLYREAGEKIAGLRARVAAFGPAEAEALWGRAYGGDDAACAVLARELGAAGLMAAAALVGCLCGEHGPRAAFLADRRAFPDTETET
jgi:hypothetical protein